MASVNCASENDSAEILHNGRPAGSSGKIEENPLLPEQYAIKNATQAPSSSQKKPFTVTYIGPPSKIFKNQ